SSETQVNVTRAIDTTLPAAFGGDAFRGADCLPVPAGIPCVTGQQFNSTALRVSPYAGFNWQIWRAVLGIEADFGFANQATTLAGGYYPATPFTFGAGSDSFAVKTRWDASVRGRAGFLVEPWLLVYGTAGPTWLRVETTSSCS